MPRSDCQAPDPSPPSPATTSRTSPLAQTPAPGRDRPPPLPTAPPHPLEIAPSGSIYQKSYLSDLAKTQLECPIPTTGALDPHAASHRALHAQSPIDIPDSASIRHGQHRIELHYHETAENIVHRQHTVEIEVGGADDNGIDFDGETYLLDQFHFHTPSEHLVAGRRFPIELHLVHRNEKDEFLVVGVLFQSGEASAFLEQILRDAPVEIGRVDREDSLDVSGLFPKESHFYTYRGSFTTPPYTEGVDWLVLNSHPQASNDQIVRLLLLEGGNARDVQDRHDRAVEGF